MGREHILHDLRHELKGIFFNSFCGTNQRDRIRKDQGDLSQNRPCNMRRHGKDQAIGSRHGFRQAVSRRQGRWKRDSG